MAALSFITVMITTSSVVFLFTSSEAMLLRAASFVVVLLINGCNFYGCVLYSTVNKWLHLL